MSKGVQRSEAALVVQSVPGYSASVAASHDELVNVAVVNGRSETTERRPVLNEATTRNRAVTLSVCIPSFSAPASMVQECVASAANQLPDASELLIFPNGSRAIETLSGVRLPAAARVVPSQDELDLVTNWNRCLAHASGSLVHILHEDDAVAAGFYSTVLDLHRRFPDAGLYATTSGPLTSTERWSHGTSGDPALLQGLEAARFFLVDDSHACGNVVMKMDVIARDGGFRREFSYCCDEEAFLRWSASGGVGLRRIPLYRNRVHAGQARYSDWLKPDFVQLYLNSRTEGARRLGDEALKLAATSSERRIVSVAITLALAGHKPESQLRLAELSAALEPGRSRRAQLAGLACRSRVALRFLQLRRRLLARRRP